MFKLKFFFVVILFFNVLKAFGQTNCSCTDSTLNEAVRWRDLKVTKDSQFCEKITLENGSQLYYQFNCDSIWLTLETVEGKKTIIYSKETETYAYSYRIPYQLIREFKNSLLFECFCSPTCTYYLFDKQNGEILETYGPLIFDSIDSENNKSDCIVYFEDEGYKTLIINQIDQGKKNKFPVKKFQKVSAVYPELQFDFQKSKIIENVLILEYIGFKNKTKKIFIDLSQY